MLSQNDIINKFNSCEFIYGYMYCSEHMASGEIIKLYNRNNNLQLLMNNSPIGKDFKKLAIYYVWGFNDFNTYYIEDYGKTWAFTREELMKGQ